MWSSSGEDQHNSGSTHNNGKGLSRGSSSSSTTLSSPSTSSSQSPFSRLPNPRAKTMEEVWRDINLSSLHEQHSRDDPNMTRFQGMILQDFLARPFANDNSPVTAVSSQYGSPAPPPPPATRLTLNSGPEFHLFGNSDPLRQNSILQPQPISNGYPLNEPLFDAFDSCASAITANGKKRCSAEPVNNSSDRRHKRMIKNRESAARSRARKQAYTNELLLTVDLLKKENARLKEQQRQQCEAAPDQLAKKNSLQRTFTAPF